MGAVWSYFFKKPPLKELLKEFDEKIRELDQITETLDQRQRTAQSYLFRYGLTLEILYCLAFYFVLLAQAGDFQTKILYSTPILGIPAVLWLLRNMINFYYNTKIKKNELKLQNLKKKQKEQIEKFLEETDLPSLQALVTKCESTLTPKDSPRPEIRQRSTAKNSRASSVKRNLPPTIPASPVPKAPSQRVPLVVTPVPNNGKSLPNPEVNSPSLSNRPLMRPPPILPRPNLPPPVKVNPVQMPPVPQTNSPRNWVDQVVDFLVGDRPHMKEPLICQYCNGYNGLLPKEEMDNLQFECKFCKFFNQRGTQRIETQESSTAEKMEEKKPEIETQEKLKTEEVQKEKEDEKQPDNPSETENSQTD